MGQIAITLAPALSVELSLVGGGNVPVTVEAPEQTVGTALYEVLRGPQGLPGGSAITYTASTPISGHTAIALNASGDAIPADSATQAHCMVAGISTGAAIMGAPLTVVTSGSMEHSGWAFTPGAPVFLGLGGALTQTVPDGAVFSKVLGIATTSTRINIDFQPAIFL